MRFRRFQAVTALAAAFALSGAQMLAQAPRSGSSTPATKAPAHPEPPVPVAVDKAFKAAYPTSVVTHVSKEKEGGAATYEVESTDAGRHRDLVYRPDGTLLEMEEEMSASSMPPVVESAVAAHYPKASVTKRERVTKGHAISYEVQLKGAGVAQVALSPDGVWISPKAPK